MRLQAAQTPAVSRAAIDKLAHHAEVPLPPAGQTDSITRPQYSNYMYPLEQRQEVAGSLPLVRCAGHSGQCLYKGSPTKPVQQQKAAPWIRGSDLIDLEEVPRLCGSLHDLGPV